MPVTAFHSVKLPSDLIEQAKSSAAVFRRSTAAQIEYWALLGKAVEESGITVREARSVMEPAQQATVDPLDAIEARFDAAQSSGALARRMREVVAANRARAQEQERLAA
jgi:ParD-like antitoxin of type II bacterial toxin-antitoxin system